MFNARWKVAAFGVAALSLAAGTASAVTAAERPAAADGESIRIGVILAESGSLSTPGRETRAGIDFAVQVINDGGGIDGRPIELVAADYQSKPELVVPTLRDLVTQDIVAVAGLESTSVLATAAPILEAAELPLLTAASNNPADDWTFSAFPLYGFFDLMAEYPQNLGRTTMCAIDIPGPNREVQEELVYPVFEEVGMPVQEHEGFELAARDLTPQASVMRDGGCDVVYVAATGDGVVLFSQAVASLGMDDVMIVTHGGNANPGNVQTIENDDQVFYALPKAVVADQLPDSDPDKSKVQPFFDTWMEEFGRAPSPNNAVGYGIIEQYARVLESGAQTGPELRDALESSDPLETAVGLFERSADDHNGGTGYWIMGRYDRDAGRFVLEQ